jgi:hypothetical protein
LRFEILIQARRAMYSPRTARLEASAFPPPAIQAFRYRVAIDHELRDESPL